CCDDFLYQNSSNIKEYYKRLDEGKLPIKRAHRLSPWEVMSQRLVYGIKDLVVDRAKFLGDFGIDMTEVFGKEIDELITEGYVILDDEALRVKRDYYVFADDIARKFFLPQYETMMLAHVSRG
ncbi:MAG: hypothetical protein GY757_39205, partial [bacterium]|nr:hypothetical protein [bacterium]